MTMKRINLLYFLLLLTPPLLAQQYTDYLGAGHNIGVKVATSSNQQAVNNGETMSRTVQ